ncbi:MAG: hypothetical protein K6E74_02405 [Bacilli bacterium]|nr:hypothetical protein [Bacilli bacterium]
MLLALLSKEDKINFLDLLRQFIIIDGQASELEKQVQKKFLYEMGDDVVKRFPTVKMDKKKLIKYFSEKPQATKNIVYMNLFAASLEDEWYNVEEHFLLDEIQKAFNIPAKKKIELMKVVYADRDLREKAKRIVSE